MGGRASKQKGNRLEYQIRDYFRELGYKADRVPSSGAAQGFKGDVKVTSDSGKSFLVECKSRAKGFESVYALLDSRSEDGSVKFAFDIDAPLVAVSRDFEGLVGGLFSIVIHGAYLNSEIRAMKKLLGMQKWLGEAQYLVIKQNHKPPLFIRYTV